MQRVKTILLSNVFMMVVAVNAFSSDSSLSKQEPGSEVMLRFTPEIGRTYHYSYSVNLNKTTFAKTNNERIEASFLVRILGRDQELYQTRWGIVTGRNNLQPAVMDRIKEQVSQSRDFKISERYVFDPEEGQSLFLPSEPVRSGACWKGYPRFSFADLSTSKPCRIECDYRLARVIETPAGHIALIEASPIQKSLTVPLESGQLGIRCNEHGNIVQLRDGTEAAERLKVGDTLVAINGQACPTPSRRGLLAERFIEPMSNLGSNITLTIQRGRERFQTKVSKIAGTLGLCQVEIVGLRKKVEWHLEKGMLLSDITTAQLSVTYSSLGQKGFMDNLQGNANLDRVTKSPIPPRLYNYEWRIVSESETTAGSSGP
jgi:hypothetical protein